MEFKKLDNLFDKLFPILRSITGEGYRKSLKILDKHFKFKYFKYASGSKVFDWVVPKEWVIKEAYIKFKNKKIIDIKNNNLHVVNYSSNINKTMKLSELQKNLFSLKKNKNVIPYVTSYYKKFWGFCLEENKRKKLKKGSYKVYINSKFKNGHVVNGLSKIPGRKKNIVLLTSYLCHPSMANNELSGPLTLLGLYEKIKKWKRKNFTYYFLINPETIGSLCFLSNHHKILKNLLHSGMVLTCLGGFQNKLSYKKSRNANSSLDRIFHYYSKKKKYNIRNFDPREGSDERQYSGGELNLPVGQIARTVYNDYSEYHSSGDNKKFMKISKVLKSVEEIEKVLKINDYMFPLERNIKYGELQLGKRGLYPNVNFNQNRDKNSSDNLIDNREQLDILMATLSYADGKHDILDIAIKLNLDLEKFPKIIDLAIQKKLIK
tara:strand:- start:350 stop:1651 length:1302 start_codon:yes stop_codon:yes gene_type:complete